MTTDSIDARLAALTADLREAADRQAPYPDLHAVVLDVLDVLETHLADLADLATDTSVVMAGDPASGFSIYGPFTSANEATDWASDEVVLGWWVLPLAAPAEDGLVAR